MPESAPPQDRYRLNIQVDEERKTLIARVIGPMPSPVVTAEFMAAYRRIGQPWLYNRIIDYRKFTGTIDHVDTEDFMRQWRGLVGDTVHNSKVAFVTDDPLELARATTYDHMTADRVRSFTTIDQALEWFQEAS